MAHEILKDNCLGIMPLSYNAYAIEKEILEYKLNKNDFETIIKKMNVLHPPQEVLISDMELENKGLKQHKEIHFLLIASQFFCKGGKEIILALKQFEGKFPFRLKIIGNIGENDFFTNTPFEEVKLYRQIVRETSWIDFMGIQPNEVVLEECRKADVGLLPSFAETYGYSALELQAAGCPMITTNIWAFPEINKYGWKCQLPLVGNNWTNSNVEMQVLSEILVKELVKVFEEIFSHPETVIKRGRLAHKMIKVQHDPLKYADRLMNIYTKMRK